MKIVHVITRGDEFYGAQKYVLNIAEFFHSKDHEVTVIVGASGPLTKKLDALGVNVVCLKHLKRSISPIKDLLAFVELKRALKALAPDVVHSHSSKAGILTRLVCHSMGINNVFTAHGWSFEDGIPFIRREIYKRIERYVAKRSDKVIAVSNDGYDLALKHQIINENQLEIIKYGVEDQGANHLKKQANDQPNPTSHIDNDTSHKVLTFTMIAGFREQKDYPNLIKAISLIKDLNFKFNFLGDGPQFLDMIELAEQLDVTSKVNFCGAVDNVDDYLLKTDVLVLITKWEGLPISIMEGLSYGLPVIATDVSGIKEEVIDGYNGLLVEKDNTHSIANSIIKIIENQSLIVEFGNHSRILYEENFKIDNMLNAIEQLYTAMVARN